MYSTFADAVSVWACSTCSFCTSFHVCGRPDLAAAASRCVVQQSGTNFHRICEAQTPRNNLSVALSTSYLGVLTAGGVSDRRWLKARWQMDLLTYLHYRKSAASRKVNSGLHLLPPAALCQSTTGYQMFLSQAGCSHPQLLLRNSAGDLCSINGLYILHSVCVYEEVCWTTGWSNISRWSSWAV